MGGSSPLCLKGGDKITLFEITGFDDLFRNLSCSDTVTTKKVTPH